MNPSNVPSRRRRRPQLGAEALESRSLLTGGAGNMFAIIPGTISDTNGTATVSFTLDPAHFHLPRGSMALGVDIAPDQGSTVQPLITAVDDAHGNLIPQAFHSIYNPHLTHEQVAAGKGTSAVLTPVSFAGHSPNSTTPVTYSVQVQAFNNTSGNFLVGFYLPGDADGNGKVDAADIKAVKQDLGATSKNQNYNFAADANRDGRIGKIDLAYALQNQGVSTDITPVVSANLNPASDSGLQDRITNNQTVNFTGTGSPGATVTFTNTSFTNLAPVSTTVDATGNYSIDVPLGLGANVFNVKSTDAFGQTISGNISAVTYDPNAPALTPLPTTPTPTPSPTSTNA
jgi:hypothetical protein